MLHHGPCRIARVAHLHPGRDRRVQRLQVAAHPGRRRPVLREEHVGAARALKHARERIHARHVADGRVRPPEIERREREPRVLRARCGEQRLRPRIVARLADHVPEIDQDAAVPAREHPLVGGEAARAVVARPARVVVPGEIVALALGQPVTQREGAAERRVAWRGAQAEIAHGHTQLAPRFSEQRVDRRRLAQQADRLGVVVLHVVRPDRLAVLAERLERRGRGAHERPRTVHAAQRLAGARAELAREFVGHGDHFAGTVRGRAVRGQLARRVGGDEPHGDDVAAAHRGHVTVDDALGAVAQRERARGREIDARAERALHAPQAVGDVARREHREHARLREPRAHRVAHHAAERRVGATHAEVGHHESVARAQCARREERPFGTHAHRAQSHPPGREQRERAHRHGAATRGAPPAHVRARPECDRRHGALRPVALRQRRRAAGRVTGSERVRAPRHVMHVRGPQDHRQSERHHEQCTRQHPGRQPDADDRGLREDRHRTGRAHPDQERLLQHPAAGEEHARHRRLRSVASGHGLEHAHEVARLLRPRVGLLLQAAHHQLGERGRRVGAQRAHRLRLLAHVGGEQLARRLLHERRTAREHLVGEAAERIEIGAVIGLGIARRLLRRHVGRRADRRPHLREPLRRAVVARRADRLGDAEVGDRGRAAGEQHVVGLDVAVHDAVLVRVRERLGHVAQQSHRLGDGERRAAFESRAQRFTLDERHGEPGQAVHRAGGVHRHDVRMLQLGREEDLAIEALDVHARRELGRQHLHDDLATERGVFGEEDARHAATAELALDRVGGAEGLLELVAQGHRVTPRGWGRQAGRTYHVGPPVALAPLPLRP